MAQAKRVLRDFCRALVILFAVIGGLMTFAFGATELGLVKLPRAEATFRSADGKHTVHWSFDEGDRQPTSIRLGEKGKLLAEKLVVESGQPYFARWTSDDSIEIIASPDFAIWSRPDTFQEAGISVTIRRVTMAPANVHTNSL